MTSLQGYLPLPDELTAAQVRDWEVFLRTWIAAVNAEAVTAENSPFNDLHIRPLAAFLSAMDTACDRMRGDHDLPTIAAGGAWNCDIATKFVKNFYPQLSAPAYAYGHVRLVFSAGEYREIDRSFRIQFSVLNGVTAGTTVETFYPMLFSPGPLVIRPPGSAWRPLENCYVLTQINDSEYAVDVPVYGAGQSVVPQGTAGAINLTIGGLVEVTSLGTFTTGTGSDSLAALAKKASTQAFASSLNNRTGAVAFLRREFPYLKDATATISGDSEMVRGTVTPLGISKPALDVFVRSDVLNLLQTAVVRLPYYQSQNGQPVRKFIGKLDLPGFGCIIEDIQAVDNTNLDLGLGSDRIKIVSRSKVSSLAPRLSVARSVDEELYIAIQMPVGLQNNDLIDVDIDGAGNPSAAFQISYRADSAIPTVSSCLRSQDVQPVNVQTLARGLTPVWFKSLTIRYRRSPGTLFQTAQATDTITRYINSVAYPDALSDAYIADAVRAAGGTLVDTLCDAQLLFSLASWSRADLQDPATDWLSIEAAMKLIPVYVALTIPQANFNVRDPLLGTADALFYAAGPRNITWFIDSDNITFEEVK